MLFHCCSTTPPGKPPPLKPWSSTYLCPQSCLQSRPTCDVDAAVTGFIVRHRVGAVEGPEYAVGCLKTVCLTLVAGGDGVLGCSGVCGHAIAHKPAAAAGVVYRVGRGGAGKSYEWQQGCGCCKALAVGGACEVGEPDMSASTAWLLVRSSGSSLSSCLPVVPFCAAASLVSPLRQFWWLPVTPSVCQWALARAHSWVTPSLTNQRQAQVWSLRCTEEGLASILS